MPAVTPVLPPTDRDFDHLTDLARTLPRGAEREFIRHLVASGRGQKRLEGVKVTPRFYERLRASALWEYQTSGLHRGGQHAWTKLLGVEYLVDATEGAGYCFELVRKDGSVYKR